jgi:hypothetical protein
MFFFFVVVLAFGKGDAGGTRVIDKKKKSEKADGRQAVAIKTIKRAGKRK